MDENRRDLQGPTKNMAATRPSVLKYGLDTWFNVMLVVDKIFIYIMNTSTVKISKQTWDS